MMVDTCVRVQISRNNECIFEKSSENPKEANDIAGLVGKLKMMQREVNDFLTTLVESERVVADKGGSHGSDCEAEDEDSEEEDRHQVNPKKCRLTN